MRSRGCSGLVASAVVGAILLTGCGTGRDQARLADWLAEQPYGTASGVEVVTDRLFGLTDRLEATIKVPDELTEDLVVDASRDLGRRKGKVDWVVSLDDGTHEVEVINDRDSGRTIARNYRALNRLPDASGISSQVEHDQHDVTVHAPRDKVVGLLEPARAAVESARSVTVQGGGLQVLIDEDNPRPSEAIKVADALQDHGRVSIEAGHQLQELTVQPQDQGEVGPAQEQIRGSVPASWRVTMRLGTLRLANRDADATALWPLGQIAGVESASYDERALYVRTKSVETTEQVLRALPPLDDEVQVGSTGCGVHGDLRRLRDPVGDLTWCGTAGLGTVRIGSDHALLHRGHGASWQEYARAVRSRNWEGERRLRTCLQQSCVSFTSTARGRARIEQVIPGSSQRPSASPTPGSTDWVEDFVQGWDSTAG
ncbi:hypothetical protein [Luteococcus sp. OSA5]|uniref:hypothetical protein n=1 Tax=Luteococcus sp. OSA5 TaxID=3401630 RepID=UPI003B42B53B